MAPRDQPRGNAPPTPPHDQPRVLKRLLGYARPFWRRFVVAILALMVYASVGPAFAKFIQPLIDGSFVQQDPTFLRMAPLVLIGLSLLRGLAGFISDYYAGWVSRRVITDLRKDLFRQLLELPSHRYDHASSGQLMSQLLFDTEQVAESLTNGLMGIFRDSATIVGLVALMAYENWRLSIVMLIVGPLLGVSITEVSRRFRRVSRKIQESMGHVGHVAQEAIEAQRIVKVFNGKAYEAAKFETENEANFTRHMRRIATEAASGSLIQLIYVGGFAAVLYVVSIDSIRTSISTGSLIAFIAAMSMLLSPIKRVASLANVLQRGVAAGASIFAFLDEDRERDQGTLTPTNIRGAVTFEGVELRYQGQSTPALRGLDLTIAAGQKIALVGHSGSGKTSLIRLLPRLYEPTAGRILIDGIPIADMRLDALRNLIAYVGQEVTLFNDTVANNIGYGALGKASRSAIIDAARAAHALEFIEALPLGFETRVGEQGLVLSGGQRQRLAIARALLKDAPILILDEATSALDAASETHVQAALDALMAHRTTLIVAHRLATVRNADTIFVLDQGRILESGDPATLLAREGAYAELCRLQFTAEDALPPADTSTLKETHAVSGA